MVEKKDLDVLEERSSWLRSMREIDVVTEDQLERVEEALDDGVVPAVSFPAHAADHAVADQKRSIRVVRVLHAAVGVVHEPGVGLAHRKCHSEG